jgi:hypothetical protein
VHVSPDVVSLQKLQKPSLNKEQKGAKLKVAIFKNPPRAENHGLKFMPSKFKPKQLIDQTFKQKPRRIHNHRINAKRLNL